MNYKWLALFICTSLLFMCSPGSAQAVLEHYIEVGLSNNLGLKDKKVSLEKSLLALREARSYFLPNTWFEAQYTLARGGRSIDIPIGDLLNPVFQTLNQLTGSDKFPTVSNASEQLLANNFYDTRIKTTMPLVNPELRINRNIKEQQLILQENEIDIYKRELLKEIKTAYYQYLMTLKSVSIYEHALQLVQQQLQVNLSLLQNGKGLPAYVSRSESEVQSVENQLLSARNASNNALAYFNFLLNRPLKDTVQVVDPAVPDAYAIGLDTENISKREELKSLRLVSEIDELQLKLSRSFRTPRINTFLDLAAQGFDFSVNRKSFYYLFGLQLQVPIFNGNRNNIKINRASLELESLSIQTDNTKKQLEMSALVARNNAANAWSGYQASLRQEEAARKYLILIDRGYVEGVNSHIEWLDARNQYTQAQLLVNINLYGYLSALAVLERETASNSL